MATVFKNGMLREKIKRAIAKSAKSNTGIVGFTKKQIADYERWLGKEIMKKHRKEKMKAKKKGKKKKPGHAKKRKAIASATSLRAAINRLKAENARLKSAKPKRRKCSCKKKKATTVAHTHHKPKARVRKCAPVHGKKRTTSLYKRAKRTVKKFAGF